MPESPQTESPQSENQVQPVAVQLAQQVAAQLAEFATDVVLCPGSRNAPLSLALIAHPGLRVHVRLDERSVELFWRWGWRAYSSGMLRW